MVCSKGFIREFLLQLYAEMAHDCTRGTWTCFESRGIPDWTPAGGYTTPSQSIVPLHLKWALVFEDPLATTTAAAAAAAAVRQGQQTAEGADLSDDAVPTAGGGGGGDGGAQLTLCKGCPRSWLNNGERIAVGGAPTSFGRVSFNITSKLQPPSPSSTATDATVEASVLLAAPAHAAAAAAAAGAAAAAPPSVALTLRAPAGFVMSGVTVNGKASTDFDSAAETVAVPLSASSTSSTSSGAATGVSTEEDEVAPTRLVVSYTYKK